MKRSLWLLETPGFIPVYSTNLHSLDLAVVKSTYAKTLPANTENSIGVQIRAPNMKNTGTIQEFHVKIQIQRLVCWAQGDVCAVGQVRNLSSVAQSGSNLISGLETTLGRTRTSRPAVTDSPPGIGSQSAFPPDSPQHRRPVPSVMGLLFSLPSAEGRNTGVLLNRP